MEFDWGSLKPVGKITDAQISVVREITLDFLGGGSGTPVHRKKVDLGPRRALLNELEQLGLIRNHWNNYYPTFPALYFVPPALREACVTFLHYILVAVKDLFESRGPGRFQIEEVEKRTMEVLADNKPSGLVQAGPNALYFHNAAWFLRDFHRSVLTEDSPKSQTLVGAVIPTDSMFDYVDLQQAWKLELAQNRPAYVGAPSAPPGVKEAAVPRPIQSLVFETTGETYRSEGLEGEGATSVVHRVVDSEGKRWALKCLRPEQATTSRTKRFLNELDFCAKCAHGNVVRVIDRGFVADADGKRPFYVMPFYGSTLGKLLRNRIPAGKVLGYFSQLLDGVEAAHLMKVWHRDLKPANVLHDPVTDTLVVSDFGAACFIPEAMYTTVETGSHERLANMQYAAPEQRAPGATVDHRADIYALGLILNEMFGGDVPHGVGFKKIGDVAPDFAYLDEIVERMRQHSPEKRFNSIDEIKMELLARKNDFVSRQRLDELKRTVVPVTAVTHPLIENPPRVVGIDLRGNMLIMFLDQLVPPEWIRLFVNQSMQNGINGSLPGQWRFSDEKMKSCASVALPEHYLAPATAQNIIENFKNYVASANHAFRTRLEQDARNREASERRRLQEQIAAEERRQRILEQLKV